MKNLVQIFILTFFLQFFGFGQTLKSSDTIPSLVKLKTGGQGEELLRDKRGASVYPVFGTGGGHSGGEQSSFLFQNDPSPFVNYLTGSATSGSHQTLSYAPPPNSRPSSSYSFSVQPIPKLGPAPSPFDNTHLNQYNMSPHSMSMSNGGGSYGGTGSASSSTPSWAMPSQSSNPWAMMMSSASTNPWASASSSSTNPWASSSNPWSSPSSSGSSNPWASSSSGSGSGSSGNPWASSSSGSGSSGNPWASSSSGSGSSGNPWASSAPSPSFGSYGSGSSNRPTVVMPPSYLGAAYSPYHGQISPNFNSGAASTMMASYTMPPGGGAHVISASALQHTAQQSWQAQNSVINQLLAHTPQSSGYKGGND